MSSYTIFKSFLLTAMWRGVSPRLFATWKSGLNCATIFSIEVLPVWIIRCKEVFLELSSTSIHNKSYSCCSNTFTSWVWLQTIAWWIPAIPLSSVKRISAIESNPINGFSKAATLAVLPCLHASIMLSFAYDFLCQNDSQGCVLNLLVLRWEIVWKVVVVAMFLSK